MAIVPRGTLNPKSAKRAVGKSERLTSSEMVDCSVSDANVPLGTIHPKSP